MGTEIQVKSNLLGHYLMRDPNDNNLCSWPPYPGDSMLPNSHYTNGFLPRASEEVYPGYGKAMVKQTVLAHEAIFRKQVLELHRLYSKQKELMREFKRKEIFKGRIPVETSLASSPLAPQITREDVVKWHSPSVPRGNPSYFRPFVSGAEGNQSPAISTRVDCTQVADVPSPSGLGTKSLETFDSARASKVRRKMFDLQLPADQYIDGDEQEVKVDEFPMPPKGDARAEQPNGVILAGEDWRIDKKSQISGSKLFSGVRNVADLNKPLELEEAGGSAYVDLQEHGLARCSNLGSSDGISSSHSVIDDDRRGRLSILEAGDGKGKKSVPLGVQLQNSHVSEVVNEQSQLGYSRERRIYGVDVAESDNCRESVMPSQLSSHYQFGSPFEAAKSHPKSVANFECQGSCSFNQKMPSRNGPSLETTSSSYTRVLHLGANQGASGEKQQFQSELPYQNGFYPGSLPSGPQEPPSQLRFVAHDHYASPVPKELVCNGNDDKHPWLSSSAGTSATVQVDLNSSVLLNNPSSGPVIKDKKAEDHPKITSWLRSETGFSDKAAARADFNSQELGLIQSSTNYALNGFSVSSFSSVPWEPPGQFHFEASHVDNVHGRNYEKHNWLSSSAGRSATRKVDLNAAPLNGLSSGLVIKEKNTEDHPKIPPWLKPVTVSRKETVVRAGSVCAESRLIHASAYHELGWKNEAERGLEGNKKLSQRIASTPSSGDIMPDRNDRGQCLRNRKILGFHIDAESSFPQTESSLCSSASVPLSRPSEGTASEYDRKTRLLDINLPCDSVPDLAKPSSARSLVERGNCVNICHQIDLNSIVSEHEASAMPSVPIMTEKRMPEIDLEAPAVPEEFICGPKITEEIVKISPIDEGGMTSAAEAIVAISSSTIQNDFSLDMICRLAGSIEDPLNWFADVAMSGAAFFKCRRSRMQDEESNSEEIDDFESMTLTLTEMKSEDYLPKPFIPEIPKEDETVANPVSCRPRRGQARRGRQRRDFQRDVLPGLASLSRHEVTEDLQTFGGLMRATGHVWLSGLTRRNSRNGGGRGRRRTAASASQNIPTYTLRPVVQQPSAIEAVGVEDRSLTSWGKTTRRPRRQRCPTGNPPSSTPLMQS